MSPKSVISYREVELSNQDIENFEKQKICANCKHAFFYQEYTGKYNTFCNVNKNRPPSGDIFSGPEIFDYYDKQKYQSQVDNFEQWKLESIVKINGTCDSFESVKK